MPHAKHRCFFMKSISAISSRSLQHFLDTHADNQLSVFLLHPNSQLAAQTLAGPGRNFAASWRWHLMLLIEHTWIWNKNKKLNTSIQQWQTKCPKIQCRATTRLFIDLKNWWHGPFCYYYDFSAVRNLLVCVSVCGGWGVTCTHPINHQNAEHLLHHVH